MQERVVPPSLLCNLECNAMNPRSPRKLITFDWAMKRLLRSKANFEILEGFLSELLGEDILIIEILESESNKESKSDKSNRVDLKVKNSKDELVIIEVQFNRELDYLQRILYGTSRVITEHQKKGQAYATLVKVISVNILYFDLGHGTDYIYHGTTTFKGIHDHDKLELDTRQQKLYGKIQINNIFPEYYLIRINNFNRLATTSLDEWIYFFKNEEIKDEFKAKGIQKAKESFSLLSLPEEEQLAYARYQDNLRYEASMVESNYGLGRMEGKEEGIEIGIEKGIDIAKLDIAKRLVEHGMSIEEAAAISGIDVQLLRH